MSNLIQNRRFKEVRRGKVGEWEGVKGGEGTERKGKGEKGRGKGREG